MEYKEILSLRSNSAWKLDKQVNFAAISRRLAQIEGAVMFIYL